MIRRATVVLFFFCQSVLAVTISTTSVGTLLDRNTGEPPDYGPFGHRYAPSVITAANGDVDCWFCGGRATRENPDFSPDTIYYTRNWLDPQLVLCPGFSDFRTPSVFCESLYKYAVGVQDGDYRFACDPSVVKINDTYWLYYTGNRNEFGTDNQIFLARSTDGKNWTKFPDNEHAAEPVIPFDRDAEGCTINGAYACKYNIGESSVIYKDGVFWMYFTYQPFFSKKNERRTWSFDGIHFQLPGDNLYAGNQPPGVGSTEVRYIPGWDLWFMVRHTESRQHLTWNLSRDGLHWLSYNENRVITTPRRYATNPQPGGNEHGQVGTSTLTVPLSMRVYYTAGDSQYAGGCYDPQSPGGGECLPEEADEPPGFWGWTLDAVDITLTPESLLGVFDGVNSFVATGWAYDADTGINDAASNGAPTAALGLGTRVRAIAIDDTTGQRSEGPWQMAQTSRPDLVTAGAAPDRFHGFQIDLRAQGFPQKQLRVTIEGEEFPIGTGTISLLGEASVDLTNTDLPAPTNLTALATTTTSTGVSWQAVVGATSYELLRGTTTTNLVTISLNATSPYPDTGLTPGTTYLYRVRATNSTQASSYSNTDIATTILFADYPIIAGFTTAQALHLTQLRQAVNAVRTAAGLPAGTYTDNSLVAGTTVIKATHITELRTQLNDARNLLGIGQVSFTDPTLTPGVDLLKRVHVQELRDATK